MTPATPCGLPRETSPQNPCPEQHLPPAAAPFDTGVADIGARTQHFVRWPEPGAAPRAVSRKLQKGPQRSLMVPQPGTAGAGWGGGAPVRDGGGRGRNSRPIKRTVTNAAQPSSGPAPFASMQNTGSAENTPLTPVLTASTPFKFARRTFVWAPSWVTRRDLRFFRDTQA